VAAREASYETCKITEGEGFGDASSHDGRGGDGAN